MLKISYVRYVLMFVLLVLLQVVVLNSISFLSYAIPLVYIYFIIKLPIGMNRNLCLLLGFILGFVIDIFSNTPGINAAATTLVALVRQPLMNAFVMIDDHTEDEPSISSLGLGAFMKYAVMLTFIHMVVLVSLEAFSYFNLKIIIMRIVFSTILTSIIIFGFEGFGLSKKRTSWRKI